MIEQTLKELGIKPVKGQNFLDSEPVVEALVEAGETEDEIVLEIGAGTGLITASLEEKAEKVYALETDTKLSRHLEERFPGGKVEVMNHDFLDYDIPGDVTRCVSNLPFQISSDAVRKLGEEQVQSALIVQDELADKMVAEPSTGKYGFFTVMVNYFFIPVKLRTVSRENYHPQPEVDTAIVKLYPNRERHGVKDEEWFFRVAKALFTHDRKKARNAFVDARHILEIEKSRAKELRDEIPHSEKRVVNLEVIEIAEIAEFLSREL
ncbi:MAG: 16S rRNA (adenine(1518)-N(6)/adenine(1519)-N(6))-dimethyltransferase RsmA [Candidatus Nanohaloarchaea archaeon]